MQSRLVAKVTNKRISSHETTVQNMSRRKERNTSNSAKELRHSHPSSVTDL